jgi:chemotaxis protein MotC
VRAALRHILCLLLLAGLLSAAQGEERRSPGELVRALQASQDQIALGNAEAHAAQRALLAHIGEQLMLADAEVWKEPKNARAIVAFVLSGGDVRILKRLAHAGALAGLSENLVKGVVAYGEGRNGEAAEQLIPIDARALDPSIAGNIAFMQAELVAKKDPKAALAYLDDARLLAPGTLIEEAALRRQVAIVATTGDFDRFEMLSTNYLRRFPKSAYAGAFRQQFAADIAGRDDAAGADRLARLAALLETLGVAERREAYLSIAREALVRGKLELARFAAEGAVRLAQEASADGRRAKVYEAAALVADKDIAAASSLLEAADAAGLADEDAEILEVAKSVAAEVGRPPSGDAIPPGEDIAAIFKVAGKARAAIARVDKIIEAASK